METADPRALKFLKITALEDTEFYLLKKEIFELDENQAFDQKSNPVFLTVRFMRSNFKYFQSWEYNRVIQLIVNGTQVLKEKGQPVFRAGEQNQWVYFCLAGGVTLRNVAPNPRSPRSDSGS